MEIIKRIGKAKTSKVKKIVKTTPIKTRDLIFSGKALNLFLILRKAFH